MHQFGESIYFIRLKLQSYAPYLVGVQTEINGIYLQPNTGDCGTHEESMPVGNLLLLDILFIYINMLMLCFSLKYKVV